MQCRCGVVLLIQPQRLCRIEFETRFVPVQKRRPALHCSDAFTNTTRVGGVRSGRYG